MLHEARTLRNGASARFAAGGGAATLASHT
jgi:hypothetical protein